MRETDTHLSPKSVLKPGLAGPWRWLRQWVWEGPQSLLGLILFSYYANRFQNRQLHTWRGIRVLRGWDKREYWGAISLGWVIIGDKRIQAEPGNQLFMHEYGHVLQSRVWGPLYLLVIGLPSVWSILFSKKHQHSRIERATNRRARIFFHKNGLCHAWDEDLYPSHK